MASSATVFLTTPVITRLYRPADYAEWYLWFSTTLLFSSVATLGYDSAVLLPKEQRRALHVALAACLATLALSLLALPGLLGARLFLGAESSAGRLWTWGLGVPALVALTGLFNTLSAWALRSERWGWYSVSQALGPALTAFFQIGARFTPLRLDAMLILGSLAGQLVALLVLALALRRRLAEALRREASLRELRAVFSEYRAYPLFMTPYALLGVLRDRLLYFLVGRFGTPAEVSFYGHASRMVNLPNSLFASAVRPVIFQQAASRHVGAVEGTVLSLLESIPIVVVPFAAIFLFHPERVFSVVFGREWRGAGFYAAVLLLPAFFNLLGNWLDRIFDVTGKQRLAFQIEGLFSVLGILAALAGFAFGGSVTVAIAAQAAVMAAYYLSYLCLIFKIAAFSPQRLRALFRSIALLAVLWGGVAWALSSLLSSWTAVLAHVSIAAVAVAVFLALRLRARPAEVSLTPDPAPENACS